jgi:formamidopyrimidine-DNA glycosylase
MTCGEYKNRSFPSRRATRRKRNRPDAALFPSRRGRGGSNCGFFTRFPVPELPEVEHLRRTLEERLVGATIVEVRCGRHNMLATTSLRSPRPVRLLNGATVASLQRHGKQMAIVTVDGRVLVVHLGMSGRMTFESAPPTDADRHAHVAWLVQPKSPSKPKVPWGNTAHWLVFRDPRRFGELASLASPTALERRWRALGPDAFLAPPDALMAALRGLRRQAKAALLDQAVLAGVGNIYADESLFRAGVHPTQSLDRLSEDRLVRLIAAIQVTLTAAVNSGGSTLRDYVDANAQAGGYQSYHLIYGRAGEACPTCGRPLEGLTAAGRTTVACSTCQRLIHKRRGKVAGSSG